jgi:phosphatidylinositol alpha-mannosyltransferase
VHVRRLRVALVHPFSWPEVRRGAERYLHDLGWYLSGAGHDVHVITGTDGHTSVTDEAGVTIHRLRHRTRIPGLKHPLRPADTFGVVAMKALAAKRYDAVHALTPTAAIGARLTGHHVVYTVLGHPTVEQFKQRGGLSLQYFVRAVRAATTVTALSQSAAHATSHLTGRLPEVLAPGVRLDQFQPDLRPRVGPPRILFPADAADARKGVDVTLAAVARLIDRRPNARLLLAGPGDPSWATKGDGPHGPRAVATPALAVADVLGVGELGEMPRRYRDATVTALPSLHEAFGLVLAESMACGTPVVGSTAGGIADVIDRPEVGATVPYGDVAALASALDHVIDLAASPDTPAHCARHARRWDWKEVIGPAHENVYEATTASRRSFRIPAHGTRS